MENVFTTNPYHHTNNDTVEIVNLTEDEWDYISMKLEQGEVMSVSLMEAARKHGVFEQSIGIENITGV
ncbi:hypothetical protein VP193E371_P0104 [Vibrio phage 193E37-1]|nr:hypothetical protein VP495E541_P0100 [Vibrio phage 495E54-1]CAH9013528.1 hypothetical protein VP496E541_P0101 [Vibrio phage 496E54-1]CAH9016995.1 hypothetical protein VP193E371_P0104 [Vibrio phage 193E37-1]